MWRMLRSESGQQIQKSSQIIQNCYWKRKILLTELSRDNNLYTLPKYRSLQACGPKAYFLMEEILYKSSHVCTRLKVPLFLNADSVEKIDTF